MPEEGLPKRRSSQTTTLDQATQVQPSPSNRRLVKEMWAPMPRWSCGIAVFCLSSIILCLCGCGSNNNSSPPPGTVQLNIHPAGSGGGTVSSNPTGINCGQGCSASFSTGTQVTLTETPAAKSYFAGWAGGCTGSNPTCTIMLSASQNVTATFSVTSVALLNHIIFLAQENRSFDQYFGALREYWAQNGYPDQSFDGLPQFNPNSGPAPLVGPPPAIPGCNPNSPPPSDCVFDTKHLV